MLLNYLVHKIKAPSRPGAILTISKFPLVVVLKDQPISNFFGQNPDTVVGYGDAVFSPFRLTGDSHESEPIWPTAKRILDRIVNHIVNGVLQVRFRHFDRPGSTP